MSTKKPSSLNDSKDTQVPDTADLFFRDGAFLHHAFCVEGVIEPRTLVSDLQKKDNAPHLLTPYTRVVDTFTIDMAREILDVAKKSYSHNAHQLIFISALIYTREAQNGLLKVLEEPQPSITIFILTRQSNQLLDTIRSRVQTVSIQEGPNEKIHEHTLKLLSGSPIERLAHCESLIAAFEKEEITRTEIAFIVEGIEKHIYNTTISQKRTATLKNIAQLRKLLGMPSASVKQTLEGVVTILNLFD